MEEFQFTQESVAQAIGKDRSTVTNLLRLLRLPQEIQKQVADGQLSMGHARALLSLEEAPIQKKMAEVIIKKGLSVRQVEDLVKKARQGGLKAGTLKPKNRDIEILEEELRKILGTKVTIDDKKGKGKLVIEYYTLDDLDRILGVLRK
jgi:ParB family chromosome partitioning protein